MTVTRADALNDVPDGLRDELFATFDEIVSHFRARRWEPSELNGGKFCEVVYTILRGHADGTYPAKASKPPNMLDACKQMEQVSSDDFSRSVRIQIPRMIVALYEIRNSRSVGHVGGDVNPNHMDAFSVLTMARWIMAELVRLFHGLAIDEAEAVVEVLTTRDVPTVWEVGKVRRVLVHGLSTKDATLLLLYSCVGSVSDEDLLAWLEYGNASRFKSAILKGLHDSRHVEYDRSSGSVEISPLGMAYVEAELAAHL